jgi:hypothetical protein
MSSAGEVFIEEAGVYLYAHGVEDNEVIEWVQRALRKKINWDDPPYLARTVFLVMTVDYNEGDWGGFGISNSSTEPAILITVSCKKKIVTMRRYVAYEKYLKNSGLFEILEANLEQYPREAHVLQESRVIREYTFDQFCDSETKSLYYEDSKDVS